MSVLPHGSTDYGRPERHCFAQATTRRSDEATHADKKKKPARTPASFSLLQVRVSCASWRPYEPSSRRPSLRLSSRSYDLSLQPL
jgi:hypothetical protein